MIQVNLVNILILFDIVILVFLVIFRNLLIVANLMIIVILVNMAILMVLVNSGDSCKLGYSGNLIISSDYSDSGNSQESGYF